jgi:tol-pal system protein YbgF
VKVELGVFKLAAAVAAVALAGCYGKQMVKGPIYTEQMHEQVDSLLTEQGKTQSLVKDLRQELDEERQARVRQEAEMDLTLRELEESIRILTSQLQDQALRRSGGTGTDAAYPFPVPVTGDSSADTTKTADQAAKADELYRSSYMDLTRGNYALAIQGFQNYLVRHPAGSHVPEVHYYLGECYYAEERHLEAVGEFQYVVREFPDSRLVPSAYLKSGLCYVSLGERHLADRSFNELIDKYPDSEEANQAREELRKTEGEGQG